MNSYRIVDDDSGFRVEPPRSSPVQVRFERWRLVVMRRGAQLLELSLFSIPKAARAIAELVEGIHRSERFLVRGCGAPPTVWHLVGALFERRERVLRDVNPELLTLESAFGSLQSDFSSTTEQLLLSEALYRSRWLYKDLLNWHGARAALLRIQDPLPDASTDARIARLEEWRGLFSPTGTPYRSLDRTLMNLPYDVEPKRLLMLRHALLERPVTNRLLLCALLDYHAAATERRQPDAIAQVSRVIQRSTEQHLRRTLEILRPPGAPPFVPGDAPAMTRAMRLLADCPRLPRGTLDGFARDVVDWHLQVGRTGPSSARPPVLLARPPIPLPDVVGIRFVATTSELAAEGAAMHHCAATYESRALSGSLFFFHVERCGERASIAVRRTGTIFDVAGPCNTRNVACAWATDELWKWAAPMRRTQRAISASTPS